MKAVDLRSKTIEELRKILMERRKESLNMRFQIASGQFKNLDQKRKLTKNIARIKTVITEKLTEKNILRGNNA